MDKKLERTKYIAEVIFDHFCENFTGETQITKRKKGFLITNNENSLEVLVRVFDLKNIVIETKIGLYNNSLSFKINRFSDQEIIEKILKEELSVTKISYEIDRTRQIKNSFETNLHSFVDIYNDRINSSVKTINISTLFAAYSYYTTIIKAYPNTFKVNETKTEYEFCLCLELFNNSFYYKHFLTVLCKVCFRELGDLEFKFFLQDVLDNTNFEISQTKKDELPNVFGQGWIMKKYFFENPNCFENKGLFRQTFYDCLNSFIEKVNEKNILVFAQYI